MADCFTYERLAISRSFKILSWAGMVRAAACFSYLGINNQVSLSDKLDHHSKAKGSPPSCLPQLCTAADSSPQLDPHLILRTSHLSSQPFPGTSPKPLGLGLQINSIGFQISPRLCSTFPIISWSRNSSSCSILSTPPGALNTYTNQETKCLVNV